MIILNFVRNITTLELYSSARGNRDNCDKKDFAILLLAILCPRQWRQPSMYQHGKGWD